MTAQDSEQCQKCKHRSVLNRMYSGKSQICCYYLIDTGHRRCSPVGNCDKFEKGRPLQRMNQLHYGEETEYEQ